MKGIVGRFVAAVVTLLLLVSAVPARAQEPVKVVLDGQPMEFDVAPVIVNDRLLVPLRKIFEALGATVDFNAATGRIAAVRHWLKVELTLGRTDALVDGKPVTLQVPPQIVGGRTMVPLRFVSEAMGEKVGWDPVTRTVSIDWGTAPRPHRFEMGNVLLQPDEVKHPDWVLSYDSEFFREWENTGSGAAYGTLFVDYGIDDTPEKARESMAFGCGHGNVQHEIPEEAPRLWEAVNFCTVKVPDGEQFRLKVLTGDTTYIVWVVVRDSTLAPEDAYPLLAAIINHEIAAARAYVMGLPRPAPPDSLTKLLAGEKAPEPPEIAATEWILWPDYLPFVGYTQVKVESLGIGTFQRVRILRDSPSSGRYRYISSAAWTFDPFTATPLPGCLAPGDWLGKLPPSLDRAAPCVRTASDGTREAVLLFSWNGNYVEVTAAPDAGIDPQEAFPLLRYMAGHIVNQARALTAGETRPEAPALPSALSEELQPRIGGTPRVSPIKFAPGAPPEAIAGKPYTFSFCNPPVASHTDLCGWPGPQGNPSGGRPPYLFRIEGGFPPPGLVLLNNGLLRGTPPPAAAGKEYSFRVCAKHLSGTSVCEDVIIRVRPEADPLDEWEDSTWKGPYTVTAGEGAGYQGQVTFRLGKRQAGPGGTWTIPITGATVVFKDFDFAFQQRDAYLQFDAERRPVRFQFSMVEVDLPEIVFTVTAAVDQGDTLTPTAISGKWSTRYNSGTFNVQR